ncbi:MAG: alpha/beta hydrolase [bacterium]
MKSLFQWSAVFAGAAYAAFCLLLYVSQRSMMYLPPEETEAADATAIRVSSGEQSLKIWRSGKHTEAILYFGGNAENVAWNIATFRSYFPGLSIYLVNYRGYAGSTGSPTEKGFYQDALNVYDYIQPAHKNIHVIGRSIGAAVATYLASQRDVERLVLITPFDSALNMARDIYPYVPVNLLLKDRFEAAKYAADVSADVHVLIAEEDGIVPRKRTDALIEAFSPGQLAINIVEGATHNNIDGFNDYRAALISSLSGRN